MRMKAKFGLLVILLVAVGQVWAQATYNRWEAKPVPKAQSANSATSRGPQSVLTKAQQDSAQTVARIAAAKADMPLLKRGLGQRLQLQQTLPEDASYSTYIRKTLRYPILALRAGTEGQVTMRLAVSEAGQVVSTTVVENTIPEGAVGREIMIQQAELLLSQLKFVPDAATEEDLTISYRYE